MSMQRSGSDVSPPVVTGLLRVADLAVILAAALAAHFFRFQTVDLSGQYLAAILVVMLISANAFHVARLYNFQELARHLFQVRRILFAWTLVILLMLSAGFLTKTSSDFSRIWVLLWFTYAFVGLCALRFTVKLMIAKWRREGRLSQRIAIVGAGEQGQRVIEHLNAQPDPGIELVGVFDDRRNRVPSHVGGLEVRGGMDALLQSVRTEKIDMVIVALPWTAEERLLGILDKLRTVPIDVRLCPEGVAYQFPNRPLADVRGIGMLSIFERPITHWDRLIKGLEDRILAASILLLISPLLAVIAILIKLDSRGPVLFRQQRYGFNNELIVVNKFRTMYVDEQPPDGYRQAHRDDPRITRIGRFLRRSSLDELPQFFNVLEGKMSVVGPRPHPVPLNDQYAVVMEEYFARHNVKPGITGWAQINGFRGETTTPESMRMRVRYDLYYIENWSVWFDLRIMVLTVFKGFVHENAY